MNKRFVDSNIFVFAFTNSDFKEECRELIKKDNLIINTLILLETYAKISSIESKEHATETVKSILGMGNIRTVDFNINLFFESIKKTHKYSLKISDLIHYTTALLEGCQEICSFDKHYDDLEIKRIEP